MSAPDCRYVDSNSDSKQSHSNPIERKTCKGIKLRSGIPLRHRIHSAIEPLELDNSRSRSISNEKQLSKDDVLVDLKSLVN